MKSLLGYIKIHYLIFIFLAVIVLATYHGVFLTFYQQDEWQTLGHMITEGIGIITKSHPIVILLGELRPLSGLMYLVLLGFYKFTVIPAFVVAISFQIINAMLTYVLVEKISKNKMIALFAGLFFVTNSVSHQAVTWVSAIGTLPATTFILTAILSYLYYFDKEEKKYLMLGLVSTIVSLWFKGVGLFLFILLPVMFFIFNKSGFTARGLATVVKANALFLGVGIVMCAFRLGQFIFPSGPVAGYTYVAGNNTIMQTVIFRTILYPLTALFQLFTPPADVYATAEAVARLQYKFLIPSPIIGLVAQTVVADMIVAFGSFVVLGILGIVMYVNRDKTRNITFALVFLFLSMLPYLFLDRDGSYFSGRYYYVSVIPAAILFGYMVTWFYQRMPKAIRVLVLVIVGAYLLHHVQVIQKDLDIQIQYANERKTFLSEVKRVHPTMNDQTVFYITSDKKYLGEITYPFQSGLGYILETWYYDSGKIPKSFVSSNFLWDLGEEGYRSEGVSGFGYFEHLDILGEFVKEGKIPSDIVYGYVYNSNTHTLSDVTESVRGRLATFSGVFK